MRDIRRPLLAVLVFSMGGVLAELYLLDHYDEWRQWVPLVLLTLGMVTGTLEGFVANRATLRLFQLVMLLFVVSGGVGAYFHMASNVEFARELVPDLGGRELLMEALRGAMPALAPGTMSMLGMIGLIYGWAARAAPGDPASRESRAAHESR